MQLPHNAVVLVADGRKMLFLRNEGDQEYPNLQLETKEEQDNPKDGDQKTDSAGRSYSSWGGAESGLGQGGQFNPVRSAMEETDFHQLAEDRFAAHAADLLKRRALDDDYQALIIVAPPRLLGELRKHYHKQVEARLTREVAKDLTDHPIPEIERMLAAE